MKTPNFQFPTPKRRVLANSDSLGSWRLGVGSCLTRATATVVVAISLVVSTRAQDLRMNELAERYVRLVLAVGQHDADYVDAYYGPAEWRTEAEAGKLPLSEIASRAAALAGEIGAAPPPVTADEMTQLRHQYLSRQLASLRTRVSMLMG